MERVRKYWKYIVGLLVVVVISVAGIMHATADTEISIVLPNADQGSGTTDDPYIIKMDSTTTERTIDFNIAGDFDEDTTISYLRVSTVHTDLGKIETADGAATPEAGFSESTYTIKYNGTAGGEHHVKFSQQTKKYGIEKVIISVSQFKVETDDNGNQTEVQIGSAVEKSFFIKAMMPTDQSEIQKIFHTDASTPANAIEVNATANIKPDASLGVIGDVFSKPEDLKIATNALLEVSSNSTGNWIVTARYGGRGSATFTYEDDDFKLSLDPVEIPIYVKVAAITPPEETFDYDGTTYNCFEVAKGGAKRLSEIYKVNQDALSTVVWKIEDIANETAGVASVQSGFGVNGLKYGIAKVICYPTDCEGIADLEATAYVVVPFSFQVGGNLIMTVGDTNDIGADTDDISISVVAGTNVGSGDMVCSLANNVLTALKSGKAEADVHVGNMRRLYAQYYKEAKGETTVQPDTTSGTADYWKMVKLLNIVVVDDFKLSADKLTISVYDEDIDTPDTELRAYVSNDNPVTWKVNATDFVALIDDSGNEVTQIVTYPNSAGYHSIKIRGKQSTRINYPEIITAVQQAGTTAGGINTKTATCQVTVVNPAKTITIQGYTDTTRIVGETLNLSAVFSLPEPTNKNVIWKTTDENIAKITPSTNGTGDNQCTVEFVGEGSVTISVVSAENPECIDWVTFNIEDPLTSIKINEVPDEINYTLGQYQLSATVVGTNKKVTWSVAEDSKSVATVDPDSGLVTFLKPGHASITATTEGRDETGTRLTDTITLNITNPVVDVSLSYTELSGLRVGDIRGITATITPSDASNRNVTWSSTDPSVATVSTTGVTPDLTTNITAVAPGSCTIICETEDGEKRAFCVVTVIQPVTSITLSETTMTVVKGTYFWLNATVLPENATNKEVNWVSSNTEICTVGSDGQCVAVAAGKCTIKAVSLDNGTTAYCEVIVTEPVTGILLNTYNENMIAGNKLMLLPTILPVEATNKNVTYVSSDPSIATVDENGIVTAVAGGSCSIKVTTEERQLSAVCNITVKEYVSSITLNKTQTYVNYGGTAQLTATVGKETATDKSVTWSSNNPSVVSVDQAGVIRGNNYGTAVISVVANDGGGAVGTCTVTVIKPVTEIGLDRKKVTITVGETVYITPTVYPADATVQGVTWSSTDNNIATVDFDGQVTGMSVGKCEVIATSTDGNNIRSSCIVTVVPVVTASGIKVNSDDLVMLTGKTRTLKARLTPNNSTEGINWVSSDTSVVVVDGNGKITTVGPGVAEVTAYSSVTGTEDSCKISVIQMNTTSITLEQYDTHNLFVDYAPDKTISWRTSNNRIATISQNGVVTARKAGTCTIYATIEGKTVSCTVTVVSLDR